MSPESNSDSVYLSKFDVNIENGIRDFDFPVVRACFPLTADNGGEFKGIVVINMHFEKLGDFIRGKGDDRDNKMVYLTNDKGYFLIHEEKDLGFSFERKLPYRARDVYRPLAQFLSISPQNGTSSSGQTDDEGFELTLEHERPRCSIFIKPRTELKDEHQLTLKRSMNDIFKAYEKIDVERSDFNADENSCHGIITDVDAKNVNEIVKQLDQAMPVGLQGKFGDYFTIVALPHRAAHEEHTVYCRKILFDTAHPERFLALIFAKPCPEPGLMSRLTSLFPSDS